MSQELGPFATSGATPARRRTFTACAVFALLLAATPAGAQHEMLSGMVGAGTGFEGGSPGEGSVAWHRARTRALVGLDLAVDEPGYNAFGFRAFVELEHRASLGGSFHYTRWVSPGVGLFVGVTGVLAPETLFEGTAGATFAIPLSKKMDVFIEPELAAMPVGSDVPDGSVVIWTLLSAGLRLDL